MEENKFLKSIGRSAQKQKNKLIEEIQEIRKKNLKKAEKELINESNKLIKKELSLMHGKVLIEISHKEISERKKIFFRKKQIMSEIFDSCRKKLLDFTDSQQYVEILKGYSKNISGILDQGDTCLFVKKEDLKYKDEIQKAFGGQCKIVSEDKIKLGGIKGYSEKLSLITDETFDSKLELQKEYAIKNLGLKL